MLDFLAIAILVVAAAVPCVVLLAKFMVDKRGFMEEVLGPLFATLGIAAIVGACAAIIWAIDRVQGG